MTSTQTMTTRTQSMTLARPTASRTALATRSWRLAERVSDPQQRAEAKARHFTGFVTSACPRH